MHFSDIQSPCLFVQGTTDPFASPDEISSAVELIPVKKELVLLDRLGHDLGRGSSSVVSRIRDRFTEFFVV